MSAEAVTWAYKVTATIVNAAEQPVETLKMAPKFVLVTLANYADQEHSSFPSIDTLADMMSCSRRTVIDALRELEKWGLVTIEKRRRTNGSQTSSRYYLPVADWAPRLAQGADSALCETGLKPVDNSADRVQILHQGGAESAPPLTETLTRGITRGPVQELGTERAVDKSGTGPKPTPATVSATYGHPLQPADVFASVGTWLPETFDDDQLIILGEEIVRAARPARVFDPTAYVIQTIRNTVRTDERRRGRWLLRADEIALEHIELATRGAGF